MNAQEIFAALEKQFPGKVSNFKGDVFEPYLSVDGAAIVEVCRFLRDGAGMNFAVLSDLTALDWPKEEKIQVVYHLFSYAHNHQIVLKVDLPRDNPKSLPWKACGKWPTGSSAKFTIYSESYSKDIAI